jgi:hypothetical protein
MIRKLNKVEAEGRLLLEEEEMARRRALEEEEEQWIARRSQIKQHQVEEQQISPKVKLQRYTITPFRGEYRDWDRFWNQFSVEVDNSSMAEICKFNYLMELEKGKSHDDITGLPTLKLATRLQRKSWKTNMERLTVSGEQ